MALRSVEGPHVHAVLTFSFENGDPSASPALPPNPQPFSFASFFALRFPLSIVGSRPEVPHPCALDLTLALGVRGERITSKGSCIIYDLPTPTLSDICPIFSLSRSLGHRHSLFGRPYHSNSFYFETTLHLELRAPFPSWGATSAFSLGPAYQQSQTSPTRTPKTALCDELESYRITLCRLLFFPYSGAITFLYLFDHPHPTPHRAWSLIKVCL
ncbi:hypothetical protein GQ43DRAFT_115956 [Delitschia confertaspora ATCC 74209]|uniref:Uncharacterized protein n=1 Tax=Delitschia confertaspora ATCC 74209 TaxID=1513339 RepID=A0A9P4JT31_9PLEO|nr:hypothetical protein GQ43DRAFT_115956 [Delitschia confertaspora ATCC 74209]